jgi:hypothetical protein
VERYALEVGDGTAELELGSASEDHLVTTEAGEPARLPGCVIVLAVEPPYLGAPLETDSALVDVYRVNLAVELAPFGGGELAEYARRLRDALRPFRILSATVTAARARPDVYVLTLATGPVAH